jgi:hypothetical protein
VSLQDTMGKLYGELLDSWKVPKIICGIAKVGIDILRFLFDDPLISQPLFNSRWNCSYYIFGVELDV